MEPTKEKSLGYMEYKIKVVFSSHNKDTAEGKADIVTELGPSLFALKILWNAANTSAALPKDWILTKAASC